MILGRSVNHIINLKVWMKSEGILGDYYKELSLEFRTVRATHVGKFYRLAGEYCDRFKIGGKQKLRKLIGEDLFYKKGNTWYFNNPKIIKMPISELKLLINKLS